MAACERPRLRSLPRARWSRGPSLLLAAGATALAACGPAQPQDTPLPEEAAFEVKPLSIQAQGRSLQGMTLQGTSLQGRTLQGVNLQGVALAGRSLQGTVVQGVRQGSVLSGQLSDGSSVDLAISAVELDPHDPSGETTLYTVLYRNPVTLRMENICPPDLFGHRKAIAVAGTWDATGARTGSTTAFTFGCTSGVIAKCVRWGYKPWKVINGKAMNDYHQACTRMARADYCGDGVSHTIDGTWIDVWDQAGVQLKTPDSGMPFEAAWSPHGAVCVNKPRYYRLPLAMDTSRWPKTQCESGVQDLSLGTVPTLITTSDGLSTTAGGGCKLQPVGSQVLMWQGSYLNVVSP